MDCKGGDVKRSGRPDRPIAKLIAFWMGILMSLVKRLAAQCKRNDDLNGGQHDGSATDTKCNHPL